MIYQSFQDAKDDFQWLLYGTNLLEKKFSHFSAKQLNLFYDSLEEESLKDSKEFYAQSLESIGYEKLKFSSTFNKHELPCFALSPSLGIILIYDYLDDGGYKIQRQGTSLNSTLYKFEENTVFAPLREKKQNQKYSTAIEMFKVVAWKQKKVLFYLAVATFCINIIALATSLYTMQVYDRVVPTGAISTLIALTIGVFIAMILEMSIKFAKSSIHDYATKEMDLEYSYNIFKRFLHIRCDAMPKSVGTLTGQLQSYNAVRGFIANVAVFILIDLPFSLIFLFVIIIIGGVGMGMIPLIFLIVSLGVGFLFKDKIITASKNSSMASYKKTGLLVETVENSENIKATGAAFSIMNSWNSLTKDAIDDDIVIKHYSDISSYITQFLQQLSYISIVSIGAYLVAETGDSTMGSLIAMTILSGRILQPIAQLPNHFVQWGKTKLAIDDLNNLYSLPCDNENIDRPLHPYFDTKDIVCKEIKFAYEEENQVLQVNNLKIKEGEKVAIVGSIGSGKSTLLKLLAGLYKPTTGKVYLDSIDLDMIKRDVLHENISYLPQNTKLVAGTLRDNLTLGMVTLTDQEIIEASKLTGLISLINALPSGLDTVVPEGGESVSGGQKQLIALTRIILGKKDIVLLDEPTASLDEGNEAQIIEMFNKNLTKKQTLIVITHKPTVLNMVDRVIVLTKEGVAMDDTKMKVLQQLNTNTVKKVTQ